jgi:hypothetical protein
MRLYLCLRNFVWILKTQTLRYVELVMEGHPSQDVLVEMELAAEHDSTGDLGNDEYDDARDTLFGLPDDCLSRGMRACTCACTRAFRPIGYLLRGVIKSTIGDKHYYTARSDDGHHQRQRWRHGATPGLFVAAPPTHQIVNSAITRPTDTRHVQRFGIIGARCGRASVSCATCAFGVR